MCAVRTDILEATATRYGADISCQYVGQDRGVNTLTIEWTARVGIGLWLIDIVQLGLGLS